MQCTNGGNAKVLLLREAGLEATIRCALQGFAKSSFCA